MNHEHLEVRWGALDAASCRQLSNKLKLEGASSCMNNEDRVSVIDE